MLLSNAIIAVALEQLLTNPTIRSTSLKKKTIAIIGIAVCIAYFVSTAALIFTAGKTALLCMEISTMAAGIYMVLLFISLPYSAAKGLSLFKKMSVICAAACMMLTNMAHWVNISVTQPLINAGLNVPDYFRIGTWPSVEMAVDYIAWGLFMSLAFLFAAKAIKPNAGMRWLLVTCGCLCIIGFLGVLVNENLWYIAPIGYGPGTVVLCVKLILQSKREKPI